MGDTLTWADSDLLQVSPTDTGHALYITGFLVKKISMSSAAGSPRSTADPGTGHAYAHDRRPIVSPETDAANV